MHRIHRHIRSILVTLGLLLMCVTSIVFVDLRQSAQADGGGVFALNYNANTDRIYCYADTLMRYAPLTITVGTVTLDYHFEADSHGIVALWVSAPRSLAAGTYSSVLRQADTGGGAGITRTISFYLPPSVALKQSTHGGNWYITGYRHDDTQGITVALTNTSDGTTQTLATIAPQSSTPYTLNTHVAAPALSSGVQYMLSETDTATGYSGTLTFTAS